MMSGTNVLCLFLVGVWLSTALAQLNINAKKELQPGIEDPEVLNRPIDLDRDVIMTDTKFESEMSTTRDRPSRLPTAAEARRAYSSQINRVAAEARRSGDDSLSKARVSINPVFEYYSPEAWKRPVMSCCPRSWNYQCRSSDVRYPCFSHYYAGRREWCCPIWPSVMVKRCNCSKCAVLTSQCATQGTCQRRYSRRRFLAVCNRNSQWGTLRQITKSLPNSCYCKTSTRPSFPPIRPLPLKASKMQQ